MLTTIAAFASWVVNWQLWICALITSTSVVAQQQDSSINQIRTVKFGDLDLPVSIGSAPIIVEAINGEYVVAAVRKHPDNGETIQLLRGHGDNWRVMKGCENIINAQADQRSFALADARIGPDGAIWILANISRRLFCYRQDDTDGWELLGPAAGIKFYRSPGAGLHFLDGHPAIQLIDVDERNRVMALSSGEWRSLPAESMVQDTNGSILWHNDNAWICFETRDVDREVHLHSIEDDGSPNQEGVSAALPVAQTVRSAAVRGNGDLAVVLRNVFGRTSAGFIVNQRGDVEQLPRLTDVTRMEWSPDGHLYAIKQPDFDVAVLYVLQDGGWKLLREFENAPNDDIVDVRLYFLEGAAEPVVVWASFRLPH